MVYHNLKEIFIQKMGVPVLFPVFPRPMDSQILFTHSLTRKVMEVHSGLYCRLDLQLKNVKRCDGVSKN
ncbi:hypothetical protein BPA01_40930 [Brevibacillus parabrevis]|uniref:Uncharacterized protein n=1 Tax=Brevibacillus parabrevis TaxID=54914 RepID=A0A4Y3PM59_BREPA|nr:hypothetical protein BPA01_40930 [Brevibacillus parabrevis]